MARSNTQNNSARATYQGQVVVVIRRGDKNSRIQIPGYTDSIVVANSTLTGHHKIEKVKVVSEIPDETAALGFRLSDQEARTVSLPDYGTELAPEDQHLLHGPRLGDE